MTENTPKPTQTSSQGTHMLRKLGEILWKLAGGSLSLLRRGLGNALIWVGGKVHG